MSVKIAGLMTMKIDNRKLDDKGEAHLIALACSPAPDGHDYWTLASFGRPSGGVGVGGVPVP